ncbi:ATP-binding cassette domain-containing protein, partial [Microbacterium sp. p3-SID336]|uniref:ATP-binding cassette domain-containing protein n=1 Tax=Microbacterium sp. p3-SID336 TaxID=2916212 RepID=UPI0021A8661E
MTEPSTPQGAASDPPLLRLRDVSVRYPGVQALDGVDLEIRAGECVALMGRNGAGKSTTVRLLSGVETPTTGALELDGAPVVFDAPSVARAHGVATVHQELTIVPGLSVAENIMLGRWPRRRLGGIDRRALRSAAQQALDLLGEHLDLDAAAGAQPIARQQLIEIARGLVGEARLL